MVRIDATEYGEVLRLASDGARRDTSAMTRRPAHRGRAPQTYSSCCSMRSKRRTRMCSTSCCRSWTTAVSRTVRAARWTSRTRSSSSRRTSAVSTWLDGIGPDGEITADARERVQGELRRAFRPEFLNRLDEILAFRRSRATTCRTSSTNLISALPRRLP